MNLALDLDSQETYQSLLDKLKKLFCFPHYFGNNINALIEGFLCLRFEEESFANFYLKNDEMVLLQIKGLSNVPNEVTSFLITAIEVANQKLIEKNLPPSILLFLS